MFRRGARSWVRRRGGETWVGIWRRVASAAQTAEDISHATSVDEETRGRRSLTADEQADARECSTPAGSFVPEGRGDGERLGCGCGEGWGGVGMSRQREGVGAGEPCGCAAEVGEGAGAGQSDWGGGERDSPPVSGAGGGGGGARGVCGQSARCEALRGWGGAACQDRSGGCAVDCALRGARA